jgi:hypothetical protein
MVRAGGLQGAGHFYLVVTQVVAAQAGENGPLEHIVQAVDLPVAGEQQPVRRREFVAVLVHVFGLDITHAWEAEGAERIEGNQFHGRVSDQGSLF